MRNNQPVTNHEYVMDENATLMSTTDPTSRISYANAAFVVASGYTLDELRSQPHNIVRHPEMPPEAFADMWATLKAGEPWSALVKNRRQNGDFYWVRANAVPIIRGSQVKGYMSVRTKPTREETQAATDLYAAMRAGTAKGQRIYKGIVVRSGLAKILSLPQLMSVRTRVRLNMLALWLIAAHENRLLDQHSAQMPTAPEAPAQPVLERPLVLLADDSMSVRRLAQHLLQTHGYRVATAADGLEALQLLEEGHTPALLIVDVEMPDMDGMELLRRMRADARFQHLPVVMLTAHAAGPVSQKAIDMGAQAFLTKPYSPQELLAQVRRYAAAQHAITDTSVNT